MPIYEYQCDQCGRIDEVLQKFSEKPLSKCGHCDGKLRKLISQNAFHLKGSGWYVTDYAGDKQKNKTDNKTVAKNDNTAANSSTDTKKKDSE